MGKLFRSTSKANTTSSASEKSEVRYLASDAVDRIALRTPALFRTNRVPRVESRPSSFNDLQAGGL